MKHLVTTIWQYGIDARMPETLPAPTPHSQVSLSPCLLGDCSPMGAHRMAEPGERGAGAPGLHLKTRASAPNVCRTAAREFRAAPNATTHTCCALFLQKTCPEQTDPRWEKAFPHQGAHGMPYPSVTSVASWAGTLGGSSCLAYPTLYLYQAKNPLGCRARPVSKGSLTAALCAVSIKLNLFILLSKSIPSRTRCSCSYDLFFRYGLFTIRVPDNSQWYL